MLWIIYPILQLNNMLFHIYSMSPEDKSPKLEPARTPAISAHPPQSAYAPAVHWSPDIWTRENVLEANVRLQFLIFTLW